MTGLGEGTDRGGRIAASVQEVESGSDEERELRGLWLSRLMFGGFVGMPEHRSYEEWLTAQGLVLT